MGNKANTIVAVVSAILIIFVGGIYVLSKRSTVMAPEPTSPITQSASEALKMQASQSDQVNQSQNSVALTQSGFTPSVLTVKVNTKVTWTNKSGDVATVNSNPHPIHTDYPPLNLGQFADGSSLSLVFDKPGHYGYHNHLNPSETGTIIVQ